MTRVLNKELFEWANGPSMRGFTPPPPFPTNGLISYYSFSESSGTVVVDKIKGNNLININSIIDQDSFLPSFNKCYLLDRGSSSGMYSNTLSVLDYTTTGNYSISLWFKPISFSNGDFIFGFWRGPGPSYKGVINIFINASNKITCDIPWVSDAFLMSSTTLSAGNIYHIVVTKSGNNYVLYVNGVSESTNTKSGAVIDSIQRPLIGYTPIDTFRALDGYYDELAIYNRAIGLDEVNAIYFNGNGNVY